MPTNEQISPNSVKVGDQIKFTTISIKDTTVYSGKVIGIGDFATARVYGDVASAHLVMEQGMSQIDSSVTLIDVTKQTFLIVKCYDGVVRPFAFEWLKDDMGNYGKVTVIEPGAIYAIKLYDASASDASSALNVLRAKGYVCKLVKSAN